MLYDYVLIIGIDSGNDRDEDWLVVEHARQVRPAFIPRVLLESS